MTLCLVDNLARHLLDLAHEILADVVEIFVFRRLLQFVRQLHVANDVQNEQLGLVQAGQAGGHDDGAAGHLRGVGRNQDFLDHTG